MGPAHEGPGGPTRARPTRAQGAHKGPAHKGPGGPTRARPTRAQGAHKGPALRGPAHKGLGAHKGPALKGPAHKGPGAHKGAGGATRARPPKAHGGATRAGPKRAQGIVASRQGLRDRSKATTRLVVHKRGGSSHLCLVLPEPPLLSVFCTSFSM